MKTCKNCKQVVNIETITCPSCEGHDFKINSVKICSLCGKVNAKRNLDCELCGKSFSGHANEYTIATAADLLPTGDDLSAGQKRERIAVLKKPTKKTSQERYFAIKAQIESEDDKDQYAFFIPEKIEEKPIVLLPSFENSEKVDVYLVLQNQNMPAEAGMEKIAVSNEQDIDAINAKKAGKSHLSVAALLLFWINFIIVCAFALKIIHNVIGFQIVAAFFNKNSMGQRIIDIIKAGVAGGDFIAFIYPALLGLAAVEALLSLIFIATKPKKAKKIVLILIQLVILVLAAGVYLINTLIIKTDWFDLREGLIVLLAYSVLGVVTSIFYSYTKKGGGKKKAQKNNEEKRPLAAQAVNLDKIET